MPELHFNQSETFDFQNPLGGVKKIPRRFAAQIFLASYPPIIYDYPADKIFCYIHVL